MRDALLWTVLVVNVIGFLAMAVDKLWAMRKQWRVPEAQLFLIAALTGAVGVWSGVHFLRHKSQKVSFQRKLWLATAVNLLWVGLYWKL